MVILEKQDYEKINITVGGKAATGKSTIVFVIMKALEQAGLTVEFDGGFDFDDKNVFIEKITPHIKGFKQLTVQLKLKKCNLQENFKYGNKSYT